mmetsp:Transcript_54336/g.175683  ORF Transcript_54336/g.175683 Transcript_54336/m.175683 type:complete len:258 (-) Transcript_54336:71-844(-)
MWQRWGTTATCLNSQRNNKRVEHDWAYAQGFQASIRSVRGQVVEGAMPKITHIAVHMRLGSDDKAQLWPPDVRKWLQEPHLICTHDQEVVLGQTSPRPRLVRTDPHKICLKRENPTKFHRVEGVLKIQAETFRSRHVLGGARLRALPTRQLAKPLDDLRRDLPKGKEVHATAALAFAEKHHPTITFVHVRVHVNVSPPQFTICWRSSCRRSPLQPSAIRSLGDQQIHGVLSCEGQPSIKSPTRGVNTNCFRGSRHQP